MSPYEWWKDEAFSPLMGGEKEAIGGGRRYGYTGKGADGVTQTMKMVPGVGGGAYDAHENEFVFDSNATQAIGVDLLTDVMDAARAGRVDVNKIREAIGQPGKPQMYTGGAVQNRLPTSRKVDVNPIGSVSINPVQNKQYTGVPEGSVKNSLPTRRAVSQPISTSIRMNTLPTSRSVEAPKPITITGDDIARDRANNFGRDYDYEAIGQEAIGKIRGVMTGDDPFYQTQRDKLAQDLGGAGAAATAAMQQRGAAAGMTEEGIGAMTATRQRDVEAGTGRALTDMSLGQQEMAIGAARDLSNISQWGQQFREGKRQWQEAFDEGNRRWEEEMAFAKQKYGDQQGLRMAEDAAFGMSWESFNAKYPNATKADWQRMQTGWQQKTAANQIGLETARLTLDNMKQDTFGARLMSEVDKRITTDPNYVRDGAWKNDQQIIGDLAKYWESSGNDGSFDPNNPDHMAWAESQMKAFSISQIDAGINEMKNSGWYQNLSAEDKAKYEGEVFPALAQLSAMEGIQPKFTEDGLELYGPDGELIYPKDKVSEKKAKEKKAARYGGVEVPEGIQVGESFKYGGDLYEYQAGDSISKIEYESGVDTPFGATADKIVAELGYDSEMGREILNDRADALASGESSDWDKIEGPDDPIHQKLLNHPSIPNGIGDATQINPPGGANDYHAYSNFENAIESGGLVKFDGRIVRITGYTNVDKAPTEHRKYYLIDIATGQTRTERAPENFSGEGAWSGEEPPQKEGGRGNPDNTTPETETHIRGSTTV